MIREPPRLLRMSRTTWPARGTAFPLVLFYLLAVVYASTVVGPNGMNFVPMDSAEAFRAFLDMHLVLHGSDQRSDWVGNLLLMGPYGFLLAAVAWPRRSGVPGLKACAFLGAGLVCLATILSVKYAQLFFPPRTVTLNYVTAQAVGGGLGFCGFVVWHGWTTDAHRDRDPGAVLMVALRAYALALAIYTLMPLDFALNEADLVAQVERIPDSFTTLPGFGRPLAVRAGMLATATLAFVPVGIWLSLRKLDTWRVGRGLGSVLFSGLLLTGTLYALATLVMGASPVLAAVFYRCGGIMIGAALLRWAVGQDPRRLRHRLGTWVPWLVVPYLLALAVVNGLVSLHWRSPAEAADSVYLLGLLPLFDYYIVPKGDAAKNVVAHFVMYMPIGAALWLRTPWLRNGAKAFAIGTAVSLAVEAGRYLRPGLEGDINAVFVGGLGAFVATHVLSSAWKAIHALAMRPVTVAAPTTWRAAAGSVEEF